MEDFMANYWTVVIAGITLFMTLFIDIINRIKMVKDNEPQLSFELRSFDGLLFLIVKNTGNTIATDIKINVKKIWNNGQCNLMEDFIFSFPFELSSNEKTQGMIAIYGESMAQHAFPYIDIEISYTKPHFIKQVKYNRQVFFNPETENKYFSEICKDLKSLGKEIDELRNPILRLANYFDGHQVAPFDKLNLLVNNSFQTDLSDALELKKNKITSREECINERIIE